MAVLYCILCGRTFFGNYTEQVKPLTDAEKFCEACAQAACEMASDLEVQVTYVIPGWVSVPEVEYQMMLARFPGSQYAAGSREALLRAMGGIKLIAAERRRQLEVEDWDDEHDDRHTDGKLAIAAACYAMHAIWQKDGIPLIWPWLDTDWKPQDPLADLVRAGALIAAEIDWLRRRQAGPG